MKIRILLSSVLALLLFTHCDDDTKKTDKCANVTCGANAACDTGTGDCECNDGYVGDPVAGCTLPGLCDNVTCGANATCDTGTGECECNDGYIGDPVAGCTESNLCDEVTCGANAACNDNTGECECNDGYIGDPVAGCTLEGTCEANTCNGHGACDDTGGTVTCDCDTGYTGEFCAACDTANGYGPDPLNPGTCVQNPCFPDPCYGHGTCSLVDSLPVCDCETGYAGGNCNRCDTDAGYQDDPENPGSCILSVCFGYDCGNGTCSVVGGNPTCTCNTGYTGTTCADCNTAANYVESIATPDTCVLNPCLAQTCSGHGTCTQSATDTASCACSAGYTGPVCAGCDTGNGYIASTLTLGTCIPTPCTASACNSHGTCTVVNDAASCACATGWTGPACATCAAGYTGAACDTCDTANGYVASTLVPGTCILNPCAGNTCSGHGTCGVVNDAASCTCTTGYTGALCAACDTTNGYVASVATPGTCILNPCTAGTCSGHGTCALNATDAPVCSCATGYTGAACADCDSANDYIASTETLGACILNPCVGQTCSGHGTCAVVADAASCSCTTGYTGTLCAACDTTNGYVASVATPGTCILNPCTASTCSGHGTCALDTDDAPVCTCATGYTGAACATCDSAIDYIASTLVLGACILNPCPTVGACSGHGACLVVDDAASCTCTTGYTGTLCAACDTAGGYIASTVTLGTCISDPCILEDCSDAGTCAVVSDLADCSCNTGYIGEFCDACDTANDYVEYPVGSGLCVENVIPQPGDLVITEIMIQSAMTPIANGQWFEVYNTTDATKVLAGLSVIADTARIDIPTDSPAVLGPHATLVVATSNNPGVNGGLTVQLQLAGMDLSIVTGSIELVRTVEEVTIDLVEWNLSWNHQDHRSLTLSPAALTSTTAAVTLNDDGDHWCFGATNFNGNGTFGTPNEPNDECLVSWCGLQWPQTTSTTQGQPTETIYGQVHDGLLTVGQDFTPFLTAQVGFGAVGSDPTGLDWTWSDATYDASFIGQNNEQFIGTLLPMTGGTFDYLYRVSSDGGLSYQTCYWEADGTSVGTLTVTSLPSCGPQVVISELYGAGGNVGAIWKNDFVVLHNRSVLQAANITGWSLQYGSATGSTWNSIVTLSGSIPAGGYFLVQLSGGANGSTLPTPDQSSGSISMSGTAGKIALVSNATALTGTCPTGGAIVDFVGFGSTANCSETAPTTSLATATTGLRIGDGCTDTNDNSSDFTTSTAAPKNSASTTIMCGCN